MNPHLFSAAAPPVHRSTSHCRSSGSSSAFCRGRISDICAWNRNHRLAGLFRRGGGLSLKWPCTRRAHFSFACSAAGSSVLGVIFVLFFLARMTSCQARSSERRVESWQISLLCASSL